MIVAGKYRIENQLSSGPCWDIFAGKDLQTLEDVAITMEPKSAKHQQLQREGKCYRKFQNNPGVPNLHWYGVEADANILVSDALGPSLQDLLDSCENRLSLKTVLMLADQMISRLELLHACNYLHRDVKPESFRIGRGEKANVVHMVNFSLAKKFRDSNQQHISYKEGKKKWWALCAMQAFRHILESSRAAGTTWNLWDMSLFSS
jgi:casein kinase 1